VSSDSTIRARIGALALHSQYDSREITAPARAAFLSKFERQVDPDGVLPAAERARRAQSARRAHMLQLARKSAKARRSGGAA
jgi:hypothetical protein